MTKACLIPAMSFQKSMKIFWLSVILFYCTAQVCFFYKWKHYTPLLLSYLKPLEANIQIATLSQLSRWDRIIICQFGARLEIQAHYFPAANLWGVTLSYKKKSCKEKNSQRLTFAELNVFNIPFKLWRYQNDKSIQWMKRKKNNNNKQILTCCHISFFFYSNVNIWVTEENQKRIYRIKNDLFEVE